MARIQKVNNVFFLICLKSVSFVSLFFFSYLSGWERSCQARPLGSSQWQWCLGQVCPPLRLDSKSVSDSSDISIFKIICTSEFWCYQIFLRARRIVWNSRYPFQQSFNFSFCIAYRISLFGFDFIHCTTYGEYWRAISNLVNFFNSGYNLE